MDSEDPTGQGYTDLYFLHRLFVRHSVSSTDASVRLGRRSSCSPDSGVEYPIPDLLGYFVYPPFNPSLPLGKKMGYAKPR